MRKVSLAALLFASVLSITGCGQKVEVPSAHVAKVMTKDGYKEGVVPTSKFRLEPCWAYCDKIVLLSVADQTVSEEMELFMPRDKLNMTFNIQATVSVKPSSYDQLFTTIPPTSHESGDYIPLNQVYTTYARQIIRAEAREFLSQYTISELASSRESVNQKLSERLSKSINDKTPFQVKFVGLADIKYPPIIVSAQENAAERREQIEQEEAQLEISKVKLERQLKEQQMQRKIDVEKAAAEAEVNTIMAKSITPAYTSYRSLIILEKMAESQNKVFVPAGMLDQVSSQVMLGRQ